MGACRTVYEPSAGGARADPADDGDEQANRGEKVLGVRKQGGKYKEYYSAKFAAERAGKHLGLHQW